VSKSVRYYWLKSNGDVDEITKEKHRELYRRGRHRLARIWMRSGTISLSCSGRCEFYDCA
jgi:hypothetical protein